MRKDEKKKKIKMWDEQMHPFSHETKRRPKAQYSSADHHASTDIQAGSFRR